EGGSGGKDIGEIFTHQSFQYIESISPMSVKLTPFWETQEEGVWELTSYVDATNYETPEEHDVLEKSAVVSRKSYILLPVEASSSAIMLVDRKNLCLFFTVASSEIRANSVELFNGGGGEIWIGSPNQGT